MSRGAKTVFQFRLTAKQAQTIFNVVACMMEEPAFKEIWSHRARRNEVRIAVRRFERQLNRQYHETGVEV